ncbi:MAG: hypothetical protein ACRC6I_13775, partial [Paracoccaceae bacterium]
GWRNQRNTSPRSAFCPRPCPAPFVLVIKPEKRPCGKRSLREGCKAEREKLPAGNFPVFLLNINELQCFQRMGLTLLKQCVISIAQLPKAVQV